MEEFLKSEQFARYRQLQLTCFAEFVVARLFGDNKQDLEEIRGGLEVIRQLIKLPLEIRQNDLVRQMVTDDLKNFEAKFIVQGLRSEQTREKQ